MTRTLKSRRGIALVVTLSIVLIVGLLVLASAVSGVIDRGISANQYRSNAAYYEAMAGVEVVKTAIFRNLVDSYAEFGFGWCENPLLGGIRDPIIGEMILARGLTVDVEPYSGGAGVGTFEVRYDIIDDYIVVESTGFVSNAEARVRFVAAAGAGPASVWDNAITAQGRPTDKAIAGNASVYGSVHIVRGDFEVDEEVIDGSVDLGGQAGVYSDYHGLNRDQANTNISTRIADLVPDVNVDLCARVKIAQGNVYQQGNVYLGEQGPPESRPLYSLHLGDGFVCRGNRQQCRNNPPIITDHNDDDNIWLRVPDTGMSSPYAPFDLRLPRLSETDFSSPEVYRVAYPVDADDDSCRWLYTDTTPRVVQLPPAWTSDEPSPECGTEASSIRWQPDDLGGYLEMKGKVNIRDADVRITSPLRYSGEAELLVGEDENDKDRMIEIGASVRPRNGAEYLATSTLVLMSAGDMEFDVPASAAPSAMLLYAGRDFIAKSQGVGGSGGGIIVGAVVAERFDLQTVPKIAYNPGVREAADRMCVIGTACYGDGTPQAAGILSNILIERY